MIILNKKNGMFRQILKWFAMLLTLNQAALIVCLYVLVVKPAATSFSIVSVALLESSILNSQKSVISSPFNIISEKWISNDSIIVIRGYPENKGPLPAFPGLKIIEQTVRANWGGDIELSFSKNPEWILWFEHKKAPQISVGIPMNQRLLAFIFLLSSIVLIFVISGIAAWFIAKKLARPLANLSIMAKRLGRGEDKRTILYEKGTPSELIELGNALTEMRHELNEMLKERQKFLLGITHDLRTPLCRMRVALELQSLTKDTKPDDLLEDIEEIRLILEQFIELSQLDMEQSEYSVFGDINTELLLISRKYERAGEKTILELGKPPEILIKPVALRRLFYNLIDNALRYGNGTVVIKTCVTDTDHVQVTISNPTFSTRNDSALVAALCWACNGQESGLGLAIVRRLVEVHDATIDIYNDLMSIRHVVITFKTQSSLNGAATLDG